MAKPHSPSLAHLAHVLERAVPKSIGSFDAAAFLASPHCPGTEEYRSRYMHFAEPGTPEIDHASPEAQLEDSTEDSLETPVSPAEVSATDFSDTSKDFNLKPEKRRCRGLKKGTQTRCRAYALAVGDLCIYHEADAITNLSEIQESGREARRQRAEAALTLEELELYLDNRVQFQAFTEALLRMDLVGAISGARASRLLRGLRIAQRNVDGLEPARRPHDPDDYASALSQCLNIAPTIAERCDLQDTADRARRIADAGAARQEYLKANQQFARAQSRPHLPQRHAAFELPPFPGIYGE